MGRLLSSAFLLAAACSSEGDGEPQTADLQLALRALDCSEYGAFNADRWSRIGDTFECTVGGEDVLLHEVRREQEHLVEELAGRYGDPPVGDVPSCELDWSWRVVAGDGWVVVAASAEAASQVVHMVGGSVQPTPYGDGPPISYGEHPELHTDCPQF